MSPSRRPYREEIAPRRRSSLRGLLTFLGILLLLGGVALGVLVLSPGLASLIPGPVGERLNVIATSGRGWLEGLISDEGALGAVRQFVEPYLSKLGLNLTTVLLGMGLLLLAVICIRILAVTSRVERPESEDEVFGEDGKGPGEGGRSPYWPYEKRPAARKSGALMSGTRLTPDRPVGAAFDTSAARGSGPGAMGPDFGTGNEQAYATGGEPAYGAGEADFATGPTPGFETVPAAEAFDAGPPSEAVPHRDAALDFSLPDTATGDAWPLVRPRSIPSPEPVAHGVERGEGIEPGRDATTHSPPAEVTMGDHAAGEALPAPGPEEMGPGLGDLGEEPESRAAGGLSFDAEFAPEEAFGGEEEALPPRHAVAPAGPGTALTGEPASGERPGPGPFAPPAPEPGLPGVGQPAPTAGAGEAAYYPPAGYPQPPVARSRTEPGVGQPVPSLSHEGEYPSEDYLADMPAPAFPPPTFPRPGVEPFGPPPTPQRAREAWVEGRPSLGAGLRKFAFPGFVLMALGAGGAYGLQTPLAAYITGGPYGQYLLASAAAVLSMGVGLWFMNGPMRPVVSRMAPGFPGVGGRAAAEAAAAMAPGRGFPAQGPPVSARPPRPAFRSVGPAPIPGRAALESGLEAPDAIDWGRLPKPSVFIPWSQAGTTIGLDIGAAWMKAVQVGPGRHGLEIVNLGLCPTPEGVVGEDGISDPDLLGEAVKDLLQSRNIIQREVVTALGGQGVIIRHVQFPVMSPDELREVLRWEAEHHIPIPPPEAVVDFTVMPGQGDSDERGNRQMRVMLVGAQKKVVEDQIAALRRAKLVPRGVDAEALACFRVVQAAGHFVEDPLRYAQAVIDLGHSSTKLGIYLRGALEMSRTLGIGGRALTQVLVEKLRVPEVEAETLKRQYGVLPEGGRVTAALSPTLQDLMFEIRRSFEFFSSRHFGQSVRHVYLIGGGARMPGIVQALGRYLNPSLGERIPEGAAIGVELVDPLSAVGLHPRLYDQADLIGTEFVTALGLALSEEEEGPAHEG